MNHLLDTNACIHCLRAKGNPLVKRRVAARPAGDLALAVFSVAELEYGAARSANPARELAAVAGFVARFAVLPYSQDAASEYVRHRVALEARGVMIGHFDLMIAAVALAHGLTVVTHNTGEFSRVPGLALEDWETP